MTTGRPALAPVKRARGPIREVQPLILHAKSPESRPGRPTNTTATTNTAMNDHTIPGEHLALHTFSKAQPTATVRLKLRLLTPTARLPVYGTPGAACFDLHADMPMSVALYGGDRTVLGTGLAVEIPAGWAMLIRPRSGLAFGHGVQAFAGTIDSDYRGEVRVLLTREPDSETVVRINPGDRIAQAMLVPIYRVSFDDVDELSETVRGAGGFGSTGA